MKPLVIQLLFEIALCLALMAAPPFLPDILLFSMYCVFAKNSQNKIAEMDVALLDECQGLCFVMKRYFHPSTTIATHSRKCPAVGVIGPFYLPPSAVLSRGFGRQAQGWERQRGVG
ncbi:hypothetical protein OUZ56_008344 [Daphnia magna]|uniref:Secreted protein n=1 Tax=Daphnia magna TaxID=35525 RepID=A0ABR0AD32_9CRUS|nr:hypothetical protein OUZ56_008344 [Daphnia magna]